MAMPPVMFDTHDPRRSPIPVSNVYATAGVEINAPHTVGQKMRRTLPFISHSLSLITKYLGILIVMIYEPASHQNVCAMPAASTSDWRSAVADRAQVFTGE